MQVVGSHGEGYLGVNASRIPSGYGDFLADQPTSISDLRTVGSDAVQPSSAVSASSSNVAKSSDLASSNAESVIPSFNEFRDEIKSFIDENNAVAQSNVERQYQYNSEEAQKNRDWQEYMSNTAHQREVQDLLAAGLNPVLSATGGSGAAVTSGATASGSSATNDVSSANLLGSYLSSLINSATQINAANINAKSAANVAALNNNMAYKIQNDFPNSVGSVLARFVNNVSEGASGTNSSKSFADFIVDVIKKLL